MVRFAERLSTTWNPGAAMSCGSGGTLWRVARQKIADPTNRSHGVADRGRGEASQGVVARRTSSTTAWLAQEPTRTQAIQGEPDRATQDPKKNPPR